MSDGSRHFLFLGLVVILLASCSGLPFPFTPATSTPEPQNTPLPGPGNFADQSGQNLPPIGSLNITVQAVVSADRRFVRLNRRSEPSGDHWTLYT